VKKLSARAQPKARFTSRLPNGDFLSLAVWPSRTDSSAEVITVQIRRLTGELWETVGRLAVYRGSDGRYSKLPERGKPE